MLRSRSCAPHVGFLTKGSVQIRSEEHTSELQSQSNLVCRLLLETTFCLSPTCFHQTSRASCRTRVRGRAIRGSVSRSARFFCPHTRDRGCAHAQTSRAPKSRARG